jgi:uncharacterized protein DUF1918
MKDRDTAPAAVAAPGDWLVVPGPLDEHRWRWGRIAEVLAEPGGTVRYRLRWIGDVHDSVVVPPEGARVEKAADWPEPAGDAIGVWPS